jgi:serine/threonine protein kinase
MKTEIEILKLVRHPNIVQYFDYYENYDYIFLVMEYLKCGTLEEYLKSNKKNMSEETVSRIVFQIANGLFYLKQYGIIHRDIKPSNIMIVKDDKSQIKDNISIKLMDFGLSKIIGPKEKSNEICGTISYIAPEVLKKEPYNYKVDIWSLGIITYYLLSRILPFDSNRNDITNIAAQIINKKVEYPERIWKEFSKEVLDFLGRCLDKNYETRINIDEILNHPWLQTNLVV